MGAQSLGDVVLRLEAQDVSMTRGLSAIEEKLGGLRSSLGGFREITELAFGFHVGRMFFEQLHEHLSKGIEEFSEARAAGMSFSDSFASSLEKMVGMKSKLEEMLEIKKQLKEVTEAESKAEEGIAAAIAKSRGELPHKDFPFVPGGDEQLASLHAAMRKAEADAREPRNEIARARERFEKSKQNDLYGHEAVEHDAKAALDELAETHRKTLEKADLLEAEYREAVENLEKANEDAEKKASKEAELDARNLDMQWEANRAKEESAAAAKAKAEYESAMAEQTKEMQRDLQKSADAEEERAKKAQAIVDRVDPLEVLGRQGREAQWLFEHGNLTKQQRDSEFGRLEREFGGSKSGVEFLSHEQAVNRLQQQLGDEKPEKIKPTLEQIHRTLLEIKNKPNTAVMS